MKILFTGTYEPGHNRVRILTAGLRARGASVIESPFLSRKSWDPTGFHRESKLFDLVYLPAGTASDLPFIRKKMQLPVLFDAGPVTGQESMFLASQTGWKNPFALQAAYGKAVRAASHLLAESSVRASYLANRFHIDPSCITVIPEGSETGRFLPSMRPSKKQETLIGMLLRYENDKSIRQILDAVDVLDAVDGIAGRYPVRLELVVSNSALLNRVNRIVRSITFPVSVSPLPGADLLPGLINSFDICLAAVPDYSPATPDLSGDLYHYLSAGKAVLIIENEAVHEFFTDREDLLVCKDMNALGRGISTLIEDQHLKEKICMSGMKKVRDLYNEELIADRFIAVAKKMIR